MSGASSSSSSSVPTVPSDGIIKIKVANHPLIYCRESVLKKFPFFESCLKYNKENEVLPLVEAYPAPVIHFVLQEIGAIIPHKELDPPPPSFPSWIGIPKSIIKPAFGYFLVPEYFPETIVQSFEDLPLHVAACLNDPTILTKEVFEERLSAHIAFLKGFDFSEVEVSTKFEEKIYEAASHPGPISIEISNPEFEELDIAQGLLNPRNRRYKENRASLNKLDPIGYAPLHYAVKSGNFEWVKLFVEHGAKIDLETKAGFTPLLLAIDLREFEMFKFFLNKGANLWHHSTNSVVLTPIQALKSLCRSENQPEVIERMSKFAEKHQKIANTN